MKNLISFCSIATLSFLLTLPVTMQAQQKIAHVDLDAVIALMPEYESAKSEIEAFSKILQKQLEAEQEKVQTYYTEVMQKVQAGTLAPKKQREEETKIQEMNQNLQKQAGEADQKIAEKEEELTEPLFEKFNAAVKKVAEANGFSYILDKKMPLYFDGGTDVTDLVKAELGL